MIEKNVMGRKAYIIFSIGVIIIAIIGTAAYLSLIFAPKNTEQQPEPNNTITTPESETIAEQPQEETEESIGIFDPAEAFLSNVDTFNSGGIITVLSNGLPDHDTGDFPNSRNPNSISEQAIEKTFVAEPQTETTSTPSTGYEFGIAINGILFEPLTAEFWNNDPNSGWNLEWSTNDLGFDFNNAHVQPDGTYHYHGSPTSLLAAVDGRAQTLLGYAADGFPIYVEDLNSSYRLKSGTRSGGPGGIYDGTYVEDYEFVTGLGDLDECNGTYGITPEYPNGTYYYVITETFPIISRCFAGTPNDSFAKKLGEGLRPGPGGPPPRQ